MKRTGTRGESPSAGQGGLTPIALAQAQTLLPRGVAIAVFLSFAFAYFFSALIRGVTATLAPRFSVELGLTSGDLGLLAGAYFLGFAAMHVEHASEFT